MTILMRRPVEEGEMPSYQRLEEITGPITEIATQYINAYFAGIPDLATRLATGGLEEGIGLPEVETIPGQLAHLAGFIRGPAKWMGQLTTKALDFVPKTVAGAAMQNVAHQMGTIGFASGLSEWTGDDINEIMYNKLEATKSGAMIGLTFGGAQFARFASANPMLGHM